MAITHKSGSKRWLPSAMPLGMTSARPKPPKARAKTMRKASTAEPVKKGFLPNLSVALRERSQPVAAPMTPPAMIVVTNRKMTSKKISRMLNLPSVSTLERLERKLKKERAKVASSGAQVRVTRGRGWFGNFVLNSFIFGITKPSPIGNRTEARTVPSLKAIPVVQVAMRAMPKISRTAGKREISSACGRMRLTLTSKPPLRRTSKKANRWRSSRLWYTSSWK
mmetsp:Transcript_57090/g.121314  ORF Transcript_57090/g.121314 Transcript_57090/m.121314 type:complete len:223 (+) Transcript_57090:1198-1866(+)